MPYTKTLWKDRVVEKPLTFNLQTNGDGTTTLIPAEGSIIESGTPINALNMNNLEKQHDEIKALAQMTKLTQDTGYITSLTVDVDTVFTSGFYYIGSAARAVSPNLPSTSNLTLAVYQFSSNTAIQVLYEMQSVSPKEWRRYASAGVWGAWAQGETTAGAQAKADAVQTWAKGFGLGDVAKDISNTDLNVLDATGFYKGQTLTNSPDATAGVYWYIIQLKHASTYYAQIAVKLNGGGTYPVGTMLIRTMVAGAWGSWTQIATTALEAWLAPALVNGWAVYSTYTAGYYKNNFGEAKLRGYLTGGTKTAGTTLFTLPAGYRPTTNLMIPAVVSTSGAAVTTLLNILSTGEVKLVYDISAYTYIALDGISFRVV